MARPNGYIVHETKAASFSTFGMVPRWAYNSKCCFGLSSRYFVTCLNFKKTILFNVSLLSYSRQIASKHNYTPIDPLKLTWANIVTIVYCTQLQKEIKFFRRNTSITAPAAKKTASRVPSPTSISVPIKYLAPGSLILFGSASRKVIYGALWTALAHSNSTGRARVATLHLHRN